MIGRDMESRVIPYAQMRLQLVRRNTRLGVHKSAPPTGGALNKAHGTGQRDAFTDQPAGPPIAGGLRLAPHAIMNVRLGPARLKTPHGRLGPAGQPGCLCAQEVCRS